MAATLAVTTLEFSNGIVVKLDGDGDIFDVLTKGSFLSPTMFDEVRRQSKRIEKFNAAQDDD